LILKKQNYDFAYLPNTKAVVDPASNLINLLGQRRRWINGSWFAFFHVYSKRR
jgi:cellulose synthase/poly-beta-1,6-N-acetylglucosamine synthase-like glycosyltransferase